MRMRLDTLGTGGLAGLRERGVTGEGSLWAMLVGEEERFSGGGLTMGGLGSLGGVDREVDSGWRRVMEAGRGEVGLICSVLAEANPPVDKAAWASASDANFLRVAAGLVGGVRIGFSWSWYCCTRNMTRPFSTVSSAGAAVTERGEMAGALKLTVFLMRLGAGHVLEGSSTCSVTGKAAAVCRACMSLVLFLLRRNRGEGRLLRPLKMLLPVLRRRVNTWPMTGKRPRLLGLARPMAPRRACDLERCMF